MATNAKRFLHSTEASKYLNTAAQKFERDVREYAKLLAQARSKGDETVHVNQHDIEVAIRHVYTHDPPVSSWRSVLQSLLGMGGGVFAGGGIAFYIQMPTDITVMATAGVFLSVGVGSIVASAFMQWKSS